MKIGIGLQATWTKLWKKFDGARTRGKQAKMVYGGQKLNFKP